jgi:redox-sensitive bicupin YhaK (pirin superfamily)
VRIVKSRVEPRYQETASDDIPVTDNMDGVSVKVIAAECLGVRSAVRPRTPAMCLDVARLRQPVPPTSSPARPSSREPPPPWACARSSCSAATATA